MSASELNVPAPPQQNGGGVTLLFAGCAVYPFMRLART